MNGEQFASTIDQTLLKPDAGLAAAAEWMETNANRGFATLCVAPWMVPLAALRLAGSTTSVCTVCGFPLGYSLTETKAEEARHLVELGAVEVDVVVNIAALIEGEESYVVEDLKAVVDTVQRTGAGRAITKVILETGYLTESQVAAGARMAVAAGASFVKTSTGFGPRGASVRDVEIMRQVVGPDLGVKAAGGIRDLETALAMLQAGASRIGTSSGIELLEAFAARG